MCSTVQARGAVGRRTKVGNLDGALVDEQQVLQLEVSVAHAEFVAEVEPLEHAPEELGSTRLGEPPVCVQVREEVAARRILHDHEDLGRRVDDLIEPNDVLVAQDLHGVDLARELLRALWAVDQLAPVDDLDGDVVAIVDVGGELHLAIGALPERPHDLVVGDGLDLALARLRRRRRCRWLRRRLWRRRRRLRLALLAARAARGLRQVNVTCEEDRLRDGAVRGRLARRLALGIRLRRPLPHLGPRRGLREAQANARSAGQPRERHWLRTFL